MEDLFKNTIIICSILINVLFALIINDMQVRTQEEIKHGKKIITTIQKLKKENEKLLNENNQIKDEINIYKNKKSELSSVNENSKVYFNKDQVYNLSLLTNYENIFYDLSAKYNVDPGFAYATWALETGYGKSAAWINQNNPAGIIRTDGYKGYKTFNSKEEGIKSMFSLISNYCIRGLDTADLIRNKWSESKDTVSIIKIWKSILI